MKAGAEVLTSLIDIRGLYFIAGAGAFVLFFLLLYVQFSRKTYAGFRYWTISSLLAMTASSLISLRGFIPDFFSIVVANSVFALSQYCITYGIFVFIGARVKKYRLMLPLIVYMPILFFFTYGVLNTDIRIIAVTFLVMTYMAANIYAVVRFAPEALGFTSRLMLTLFSMVIIFCALRIYITVSFPSDGEDFMQYSSLSSYSTLLVSLATLAIYFGLILLNFQRVEADLVKSREEIKNLQGLLPICSYCNKIRDDNGEWTQLEEYISHHSDATFSHGICAECAEKNFPEVYGSKNTDHHEGAKKE